ncbi:MAG: cysteine desulfurase [Patescibacteria group bacterium]|jgi:cysteine desulfurase/selenocysteine lyase
MNDISAIRKDFPILSRVIRGKPLVYLDSAATSQKPLAVIEATDTYYRQYNANVHRGIYVISEEATAAYERTRELIRAFINAPSVEEIIYTRNATESLNLIRFTWGRQHITAGDLIVVSQMEHHSNMVPWQLLAAETGARVEYIPFNPDTGHLDMSAYAQLLAKKPKLVGIVQMSNALGTINPVKEMTKLAHDAGAVVVVDGCQSAPHFAVDVQDIDADFYAFSGHKMLGPTGIGILYGKKSILEKTQPFLAGGDMIKEVTLEGATWNDLPYKFEAGTPNVAGTIGLGAAIEYINKIGMSNIWKHEQEMVAYVLPKLKSISGVRIIGSQDAEDRGAAISFTIQGAHPHDMASIFDDEGVAIRAGHLCAQPALQVYGVDAVARASFYLYNTKQEADIFLNTVEKVKQIFG